MIRSYSEPVPIYLHKIVRQSCGSLVGRTSFIQKYDLFAYPFFGRRVHHWPVHLLRAWVPRTRGAGLPAHDGRVPGGLPQARVHLHRRPAHGSLSTRPLPRAHHRLFRLRAPRGDWHHAGEFHRCADTIGWYCSKGGGHHSEVWVHRPVPYWYAA